MPSKIVSTLLEILGSVRSRARSREDAGGVAEASSFDLRETKIFIKVNNKNTCSRTEKA
jgi:fructosamine-3-kinase